MSFANKCFFNGSKEINTGSDYINRKRAKQLYKNVALDLAANQKSSPVLVQGDASNNCLASVGGFNVSSYDTLLNLTKGAYQSNTNVSAYVAGSSTCDEVVSDCLTVRLSTFTPGDPTRHPPDYTHDINEGVFLTATSSTPIVPDPDCEPLSLSKELDISGNTVCNYTFANMITKNRLRDFAYPTKFSFNNV